VILIATYVVLQTTYTVPSASQMIQAGGVRRGAGAGIRPGYGGVPSWPREAAVRDGGFAGLG
jgi:hypothetical protein